MKKRILSILLALCMVLAFMPQAVFANSNEDSLPGGDLSWEYDVWIGGTPVTRSQLAGPGWLFDPDTYTLTLREGFDGSKTAPLDKLTNAAAVIYVKSDHNLTIALESDITLGVDGWQNAATSNNKRMFGIYAADYLTITGSHRLDVYGSETAIWCKDLTVDGVTLNCSSRSTAIYTNGDFNIQNNADVSAITKYGIAKNTHFDNSIDEIYSNDGVYCIFVKGSLNVENSVLFSKNTYCERENVEHKCECWSIFVTNSITVSGSNACITGKMEVNAYTNPNDIVQLYAIMVGRTIYIKNGGTVEGFVDGKTGQKVRGILSYYEVYYDEGGGCINAGLYAAILFEDYEGTVREGYNLPAAETPGYRLKFSKVHELTEITTDPNAKYNCYCEIKVTRPTSIYFRKTDSGQQWSFYKDFSEAYPLDSTTIDLRNISDSAFVKRGWNSDWGTPNIHIQSGNWTIIPPSADKINYYIESGTQTIQLQDQREYAGGHIYIAENATVNIQGDGIGENWDISPINSTATAGGTVRFVSGTVKNAQADMANKVYILGGNINFNLKDYSQVVRREDGLQIYKDIYALSPCTDRLTSIHTGEQIITPEESYYYPIGEDDYLVVWTVNDLPIKYVTVTQEDGETYNLIPGGSIEGLGSEYHRLVRAERYREFVPNPDYKFFRNPDESVTMNAAGSINTYENQLDSAFYGPYLIGSTTDLDSSLRAEWSYQNDNGEKVVVGGNSLTCTIDDLSDIVNYRTYTCTVYEKAADGSEKAIGSYHAKVHVMRWEQPDTVYAAIGKEVTFTVNPSAETKWAAGFLSTLKWQVNKGTSWEDIPKSNTDSYTVTLTEENAFYKYRRVVWGSTIGNFDTHEAGIYVEMNSPELSVTFAPEITSQPQSIKIQENDTAKHALRVSANNAESYQWQKKVDGAFADIEGATSSTLEVGVGDVGTYRCVVSNAYGETVSEEATVTMHPAPSCGTLSPVKATLGTKAEFGVSFSNVSGDGSVQIKWQYSTDDGATWVDVVSTDPSDNISMFYIAIEFGYKPIGSPGATTIISSRIDGATMTINKTTADMDGWKVRCVLTDAVGVYYSNTVELSVEMPDYTVTFNTDGGTEIASKTPLKWEDKVLDGITAPTKDGWKFIGWKYGDVTVMPQTTYKELAADAAVTSIELKAQWEDITAPTGKIAIGTNSWKAFLNKITFGLFFKDTKTVTITASDNSGEAVTISYLLSDKALTADDLAGKEFIAYTGGFDIEPNNEWIIYVMLTDEAGNVTYLSSDGIVLDNVAPVISGVKNGKTYCGAQTVTVDEKYIDSVTVNGKEVTLQNNQFTLPAAEGTQKILATDKAGNVSAEITVTVNDGHTDENNDHKCDYCGENVGVHEDKNKDHACDYGCSEVFGEHKDDNKDHACDYGCDVAIGVHEDKSNDHKCEYCGKEVTTCKDDDKDHKCDICGATLSEHAGGTVTCTEKAVCEYCHKEYGEPKGHNYKETILQPTEFTMGGTLHKCDNCGDQYWVYFTKKDTSYEVEIPGGMTLNDYLTISEKPEIAVEGNFDNPVVSVFLQDQLGTLKRMEDDGIKLYKITEGAEQVVVRSDKKIVFRSDAPFDEFDKVMINGLVLDKKYYSVKKGSTIVTLNEDFAKEIPTGMHLFGIISKDGVAITTFTVDDKAEDNNTDSPQTGDNSHMALWIALLFVGGGLLTVTGVYGKRKTQSKN